ncbi:hypothetical protein LMG27952_07159 [Paraburkholderia hiiakae]|uniref:Uncharacterized protein n=1 Tax=Paraburkholderia hiiakae TaxID=1081782 RepID=A0ABM8PA61_9BURK|nr:hypothetical protein [Paraburkholderia hiiakae]CAD6560529.1 hypothetical protein LMG27952_07159 [Paraburkholderia hiiakae]
MTGSTPNPVGSMSSGQNMPTQQVTVISRLVSFVIYCAPRDDHGLNPMYTTLYGGDDRHTGVTDSASYLNNMPYVIVDADTKKVIYPTPSSHKEFEKIQSVSSTNTLRDGQRKMHALPPIHIPDDVSRIALHIANDSFHYSRTFQLFPWTVPDVAHSKVHIYELRSDLRERFSSQNHLPNPSDNTLAAKPGAAAEYFGYLDGDLWLRISHEFTDSDITRLCPPETISRNLLAGASQANPLAGVHPQTTPVQQEALGGMAPHADGLHAYVGPITGAPVISAPTPAPTAQPSVVGSVEQVHVDWLATLAPIYAAGEGSRSMAPFTIEIGDMAITLAFISRALANAINTSTNTTIQQALRRTSPRTFAAILRAAWRLHIDKLSLSSSWRPMLGSRLHKMGVGLDVTEIDDSVDHVNFTIHNHSHADRGHAFPQGSGGQKLARLYQELNGDSEVMHGAVYTPWVNWVEPHDTHMHITVKDE